MKRWYIVDNNGATLGEAATRHEAEMLMRLRFTQEEIEDLELEVVEG